MVYFTLAVIHAVPCVSKNVAIQFYLIAWRYLLKEARGHCVGIFWTRFGWRWAFTY